MSIANIASQIDGVTFISTGSNVERPVIHGLYGNRILVLNNYLKHGFQNWGDDHAPEINVSSVDRISVIKGSSGVRFGPEALGGAVIVEPDPMKLRQPFYIKINSGYQSNGKGSNLSIKTGNGYKKLGFNIGLDYIKIGSKEILQNTHLQILEKRRRHLILVSIIISTILILKFIIIM